MGLLSIPNTRSPSGRFELVWGLRGVSHPKPDDFVMAKDADILNAIFDRRSGKLVGTLPKHTRFARDGRGPRYLYKDGGDDFPWKNHSELFVTWNPTEETLVVVHAGKWSYNAIYFGERVRGEFRFQEIGDAIEDFVRAEARRRHPREYAKWHRADGRDPYVEISEGRIFLRPGLLSLPVECNVVTLAKQEEKPTFAFSGRVELRVTDSHRGLRIAPARFLLNRR